MRSNELLELKGRFLQASGPQPGPPTIPADKSVTASHIRDLSNQLRSIKEFWYKKNLGIEPLVGVYYRCVVAKSNRVQRLFSYSATTSNAAIVGARFYESQNRRPKHLITYSVPEMDIDKSIHELDQCASVVNSLPNHEISGQLLSSIVKTACRDDLQGLPKTVFAKLVKDVYYIDKLGITHFDEEIHGPAIVSLFRVNGQQKEQLLTKFGIEVSSSSILGDAILLNEGEFRVLREEAPYLIAMASLDDLSSYSPDDFAIDKKQRIQPNSIPSPHGEPTIGVIDKGFFSEVYFGKDWVTYTKKIDDQFELTDDDKAHGTAVTSIIVDGPRLNPEYDDGCGRFRVRHFCVAKGDHFSSFSVMKKIESIVDANPDIKVWNLSLGSELAVRANSISPEAAILDQIQAEKGVVFVVAGTNNTTRRDDMPIGAPADSINSLVVNSVDRNGNPASYSRRGPVLSFFAKPDISYYGGTPHDQMTVAAPFAASSAYGTSIAAPWIARKMAYLIEVMKLEPQVAKALLIHSATSWNKIQQSNTMGYGVVPIRIEDILYTERDEIRFIISQDLSSFRTYNLKLPIPTKNGKFPFKARATLCYFPTCSRNQGVDYTDCEVSLTLGRMAEKTVKKRGPNGEELIEVKRYIKPINNDSQDMEGFYTDEDTARRFYRKWDNVKHIGEILKTKNPGCKQYESQFWGIAFSLKTRLEEKRGETLRVGLVVTLKEVTGANRFGEFRYGLEANSWIVNSIDMHSRAEIVERATIEELRFDE